MNISHTKSRNLIENLLRLERSGKYEEAFAELGNVWLDKSKLPDIENFDKRTAAEILARCGNLIGLLGNVKLIPNAQENSKNLLTEAYTRFQEIFDIEKIAECENYLAMAYWRTGELNEAETWLDQSLSHHLPNSSDARLYTHITKSLLNLSRKNFDEIVSYLTPLESYFRKYGDDFLNGSFCCNLGIALKNTDNLPEALRYFELAKYHHGRSGHRIYLATVENNIAFAFKHQQKFSKAHEAIDNAIKIFKNTNDRTRYGFAYDTKALIFVDESKYKEALDAIEKGISILEKTENADCLVETYVTKFKTLLLSDKTFEATKCLSKAVHIAETKIGENKVREIIGEYEATRNRKDAPLLKNIYTEKQLADEDLELVLSAELSHYSEIEGVWIRNKELESIGLTKGSLAIVVREDFGKGDLIAITELDSEAVSCGFYDFDFGIVCLSGIDSEPRLFDKGNVSVLGKIVGVAKQKDENGKMYVEAIQKFENTN